GPGNGMQEAYGVRLCYHPDIGLMGQSRDELYRIMDSTRPEYFFLCPDTAHLLGSGCNLVDLFSTYRSRIIHVHFKDFDFNWHNEDVTKPGLRGGFVDLDAGVGDFHALTDNVLSTTHKQL